MFTLYNAWSCIRYANGSHPNVGSGPVPPAELVVDEPMGIVELPAADVEDVEDIAVDVPIELLVTAELPNPDVEVALVEELVEKPAEMVLEIMALEVVVNKLRELVVELVDNEPKRLLLVVWLLLVVGLPLIVDVAIEDGIGEVEVNSETVDEVTLNPKALEEVVPVDNVLAEVGLVEVVAAAEKVLL